MRRSPLVLAPLLLLAAPAAAQDVAVLGISPVPCYIPDVQAKVQATGLFTKVDLIDIGVVTPSLATLLTYDAVLVYSDCCGYADAVTLGDNLADYVDAGGGVVTATFVSTPGLDILGRWKTGYEVLLATGQQQGSQQFLGTVHVPGHPTLNGVTSFDGGWDGIMGSFRPFGAFLAPGATLVAEWTDGTPLVVEGANPKRVDLGFYPPSGDCDGRFWNSATDGDLLLANSLLHVAGGGCQGQVYCDTNPNNVADLNVDTCSCAAGSILLTVDGATPGQFGYPLVGASNSVTTDPPGALGDLCLTGSPIGRYALDAGLTDGAGRATVDLLNAVSGGGGGGIPNPPGGNLCSPLGQTWNFQWWYRDGMNPSRFSKAVQVTFQ